MAGTALLLALVVISLCVLVDPYWVFGTPTVSGWTALKPRAGERSELAKTYLIQRNRPRTVLLGNSRVEVGLNPESQEWPQQDRPVFNAALAGRELSASIEFLRKALALGRVNLVVLGVDYPDFVKFNLIPPVGAGDAQQPRHSGQAGAGRASWEQVWRDRLNVTLSIDAVTDSLMTLLDQSPHTSATMTRTGLDPRRDYTVFVRRDGYYSLFAQKRRGDIAYYRPLRPLDFRDPLQNLEFRRFAEIVRLAVRHDCHLVVFVQPYHTNYLEMLHQLGFWASFEDWKRALVQVVDHTAGSRRDLVRLYDFSDYNDITAEPVPAPEDTQSTMQWYWEQGHYKSTLGDLIIAQIVGKDRDFGEELDSRDIETDLQRIDRDRELFEHPVPAGSKGPLSGARSHPQVPAEQGGIRTTTNEPPK